MAWCAPQVSKGGRKGTVEEYEEGEVRVAVHIKCVHPAHMWRLRTVGVEVRWQIQHFLTFYSILCS